MLGYLASLIGFFTIIAVLPARGQAADNNTVTSHLNSNLAGGIIGGIIFLFVLVVIVVAWQSRQTQAKDDDKILEELRIIYGFWLIVAVLLIALLVLIFTLITIPLDVSALKATDIVAIAGTVTGLITTLTAAFFGIQQAGAGRSQALTALAQGARADGAVAGTLDPSYGPHSGGTKVSITGNGFTGASG